MDFMMKKLKIYKLKQEILKTITDLRNDGNRVISFKMERANMKEEPKPFLCIIELKTQSGEIRDMVSHYFSKKRHPKIHSLLEEYEKLV